MSEWNAWVAFGKLWMTIKSKFAIICEIAICNTKLRLRFCRLSLSNAKHGSSFKDLKAWPRIFEA